MTFFVLSVIKINDNEYLWRTFDGPSASHIRGPVGMKRDRVALVGNIFTLLNPLETHFGCAIYMAEWPFVGHTPRVLCLVVIPKKTTDRHRELDVLLNYYIYIEYIYMCPHVSLCYSCSDASVGRWTRVRVTHEWSGSIRYTGLHDWIWICHSDHKCSMKPFSQ